MLSPNSPSGSSNTTGPRKAAGQDNKVPCFNKGTSEEQSRVTEVQLGARVTACWASCSAMQPSTYLGTSQKKSRAEICLLGKNKPTNKREEKTHNPERPYKQQQGTSNTEARATIRSQSHPGCYQICYGDNVDHLLHELSSSTGVFSLASLPYSSLKHLFRQKRSCASSSS